MIPNSTLLARVNSQNDLDIKIVFGVGSDKNNDKYFIGLRKSC